MRIRLAFTVGGLILGSVYAQAQFSLTPLKSFGNNGWLAPNGVNGSTYTYLTTNDTERGLAAANGHLYLVSRNGGDFVRVLDGQTGAELRALSLGSGVINGGTFDINMVAAAADGAIYVGNLATGPTAFNLYRWANDLPSTTPTLVYSGVPLAGARIGDSLAVVGSGSSTLLAAGFNSLPNVSGDNGYAIVTPNTGTATAVGFSTTPPAAGDFRLGITFTDATHILGTQGGGSSPLLYTSFAGALGTLLSNSSLASTYERALSFAIVGGFPLLAALSTTDNHVSLYTLTDPTQPVLVAQGNATTGALSTDSHNTGAVVWGAIGTNTATLYAMATDDGIQAFTVTVPASAAVAITNQPQSQTVMELLPVRLDVGASGNPPPSYQWFQGEIPIAGATNATYVIAAAPYADNGAQFKVVVQNMVGNVMYAVTSSVARLTVIADTNPPALLRAQTLGLGQVGVSFSERLSPATATNLVNYAITGTNGTVLLFGAALDSTQANVVLQTSALTDGSYYTLTVNHLADQSVAGNVIAPNSQTQFLASTYAPVDIGNPSPPGSQVAAGNGYDLLGGGAAIGGNNDQFQFSYQLENGDFDYAVRLDSVELADAWSEAGLMVREDLTPGGRFAAILATPSISGAYFRSRAVTNGAAAIAGSFPVSYPNMWLRLKRAGNALTGYAGYEGQNWAMLGTVTLALPPTLYFGFAVSSHNTNQVVRAAFRDLAVVTNVGSQPVPIYEGLGQSSRATSLVISELMYHPTNGTLEFVELFNSRAEPQDLSGYQLGGSIAYVFPAGTIIAGGGFVVVASNPASLESAYGLSGVLGPYTGHLPGKGGTVSLTSQGGGLLLEVKYGTSAPWPVAADGAGHSLVLARPSFGEGNPLAWAASDAIGGSPGKVDPLTVTPLRKVVINEFLAHTDPPDYDYIELYNHSSQPVDISGCILTDNALTNKFVVPAGTVMPPNGFLFYTETNLNFALSAVGATIYLKDPENKRVLDAVRYEGQENRIATGRYPDGADQFYRLAAKSPGAPNGPIRPSDIVINEIMFAPISLNDDDQYIELYNRSDHEVNLGGWQLTAGISFTFPVNTLVPADGYLVVARNAARLQANYANLNSGNLIGDFSGTLSHKGEQLTLRMSDTLTVTNNLGVVQTNLIAVVVNEVTYGVGGRWGQWADGGGSSLELIDPHADNTLGPNWADSDETQKASWAVVSATGTIDNGDVPADELQVLLQGVGEALVDNIQVLDSGGNNRIANGTFESGAAGWTAEGTEKTSSLETSEGYASSQSYHVRAVEKADNQINRVRAPLTTALPAGSTNVTIQAAVRWLRGDPEILLRLRGNWLECASEIPTPSNLGSPGARNSRYISNAPPAIVEVRHAPVLPAGNEPIVVSAQITDPDGVSSVALKYRLDPSGTYNNVPMTDSGTGGDAVAGDGIYSATIPGQAAGTMVAFYVQATDGAVPPASGTFPNTAPAHECLVRVGELRPTGNFPVYRVWMSQATLNTWNANPKLDNSFNDITFVLGDKRVIYNAGGRYKGSPYISPGYCGPTCGRCGYSFNFPADDLFLGEQDLVIDWPGGHGGETTALQEQMCYWIADRLNLPWSHRHTIRLHVNGVTDDARQATFEAVVQPAGGFIKEWSPNDTGGELFKIERAFEFSDSGGLTADPEPRLQLFATTGGRKKREHYRWNFMFRSTDRRDDYSDIFALVDAVNAQAPEPYTSATLDLVDMEEWMGVFATEHIIVNFDAYGHQIGKNMYAYLPPQGRWQLYLFDLDWAMLAASQHGSGYSPSSAPLFNADDPTITRMYAFPPFARAYWRAVQNAVNGPLDAANCNPVIDAKSRSLFANGIAWCDGQPLTQPGAVKTWFSQRRTALQAQLAAVAAPFAINSVALTNNVALISGTAPIGVKTVQFNGTEWPLVWTSVTGWTANVPLGPGTNLLNLVGVDVNGNAVAGAGTNLASAYNGGRVSPVGQIVLNEIMCRPPLPGAEYVELYNSSSTITFDLSGWQLKGLGYTFPAGSMIGPNGYLVLAANRAAFAAAYGGTNLVFDVFAGTLQNDGETLTLLQPGTNVSGDLVVSKVRYSSATPWPAPPQGSSLQLIDPRQDNWRVGNWACVTNNPSGSATPGTTNSGLASLPPFPSLWINELESENLTGITNGAGQRSGWIELYNPSTNRITLGGLYLSTNYAALDAWAFPSDAAIGPGQFLLLFADGQAVLSSTNELHTSFTLNLANGSLALSRLYNGKPQVLDYLDYTSLPQDNSYGSVPDGQSFDRLQFFDPTPNRANAGSSPPSFIAYSRSGSVYAQDFNSLPNPGLTSINSANPVTINGVTYSLANPFEFAATPSPSGGQGGLGLAGLAGWYGLGAAAAKFGASDGDQTTGGQLSFGPPGDANRALGLLATSSTGATAFGVKFVNETTNVLAFLTVHLTGEMWRQSDIPKALECYYFLDLSGAAAFSRNRTGTLPELNVTFPANAADSGGLAVDGTLSINQTNLSVIDRAIVDWPSGAALWLVWEMADASGKAQGLAIDNLSFQASDQLLQTLLPPLGVESSKENLVITWPTRIGLIYQLEYKDNLAPGPWTALGPSVTGTDAPISITNGLSLSAQRFYRLRLVQ